MKANKTKNAYATFSTTIKAPNGQKKAIKSTKSQHGGDMRGGKR